MIVVLSALAAPPTDGWPEPVRRAHGAVKAYQVELLDRVELLDVGATHGMLRVVHRVEEGEEDPDRKPVDCGYAGMKAEPYAGVSLVVFELATGAHEAFDVYVSTLDRSECLDHAASTRALDAAKARASALGLDVTRKPAPLDGGALTRPWGKVTLMGIGSQRTSEMDDYLGELTWTVVAGDRTLYESKHQFARMMAGSARSMQFLVWEAPKGVVALENIQFFSGRGGTNHTLMLTPVLTVP